MQWQFKLFEFEICDTVLSIEEEDTYTDTKEFLVKMFGIDEYGHTACIYVKGFQPYFYVKVDDDWTQQDKNEFLTFIKNKMGKYFANSLVSAKIVNRHKLYGFDAKKHHKFIQLKFNNTIAMTKAKNLWYEYNKITYSKKLIDGGLPYKDGQIEIYEAQIPPLLRLFHIKEISPSGWIALLKGKYTKHKEETTNCNHEFTINYKNIIALPNRETMVPYKIMSFDIEASSSHGDFPLPIKNYKKLAVDIIDKIKLDKIEDISDEFLKSCIKTAFEFGNEKDINKVYLKEKITEEQVDKLFEQWIKIKPANHTFVDETLKNELEDNDDNDDNEDDENDIEEGKKEDNCEEKYSKKYVSTKKYTNKEATINDVLKDTCDKNIKIHELTKSLSLVFPEIEGDKVTFIGSTIRNYGQDKPYLKHCIVVGDCDEVEGSEIVCVENEKEALLEWTKLMEKENPDIIIGYNIHGWDEEFMYKRAIELNCVNRFLQLSRLKNHVCLNKDWRTGKKDIERNSLFIASGQYDIKFINTIGRLQIDLLNVFRREYQLTSYKLDYVSGHFISDKVSKIEYNEEKNISRIYSKNFTGLYKNDFIVFEEIGHSTNKYNGGKKYEIINIDYKENYFEVNSIVNPDMKLIVKWCLGKDDVTPQDIFRLTHEGPEGRKIVAKYCIKDCELVDDLLKKTDIMTGYIEMAKLTTVPISFLVYRGQGIKGLSYVAKKCREKKTLMPVIDKVMDDGGYEGAIVLQPKCNLYLKKPVACVDYSSLYPSSIISENLSHDSKVWTKEYDLENNLVLETGIKDKDNNYIYDNLDDYDYVDVKYDTYKWIRKTPKGAAQKVCVGYKICRYAQFKDGTKGILPSILEELLAARKSTKKLAAKEEDPFMKNILDNRQLSIKIVANSLYGQTGAKTSAFYDKDVAASTTATGRKLLLYGKKVIEKSYENRIVDTKNYGKVKTNAEYIYGDSVAKYTPINVRYNKKEIVICTVEELAEKYGNENGWVSDNNYSRENFQDNHPKEFCELNNIESWTENGWTKCHRVIRHKLNPDKKMVRILTHTGLVDVTEDHSLVTKIGDDISPKNVKIGTELLHKTMEVNNYLTKESIITEDEAKIMGFFFGDGSCGTYNCLSGKKSSWALNNSNSILLNKYYELCKKVYPNFEWKIYDTLQSSGVKKISFNVNKEYGKKVDFINNYRNKLYCKNIKIIPSEILNSSTNIRNAFWEGLYDADGDKDKNGYIRIDQKNQLSASHICWLANSIGYKSSINIRNDKLNIYRITLTKGKQRKNPDAIKKIMNDLPYIEDYVYDLTTENHHFAAGIGNMIVHNTDSVFFTFNLEELDGTPIEDEKALEITIELAQEAGELATKFLKKPHDLEYEKTFLPFCLLSKKRYVGILYELDPKKGKRKEMGIVLKRRDNAPIVKDIYGGVIDILMKEKSVPSALNFTHNSLQDVIDEKNPIDKLIITKSLRSEYKNPQQIAHYMLAKRMGERDPGNKHGPGDRIPFAYIKNENKKALQCDKIENPKYIQENKLELDYNFYITNQIMKPLQQLFALVLEQIEEFKDKRGYTLRTWKDEINKLKEKWPEEEKFLKKYEELRCKEIKSIIFDKYIKK